MTRARSAADRGWIFRVALFAAAASLAAYIPYKYATQLHAISGLYAFVFPMSALLAAAGLLLAAKPAMACDCSRLTRSALAALSGLWLATGALCVGALADAVVQDPLHGSIATLHMLTQHVFLSLTLIAFAWAPQRVARLLGVTPHSHRSRAVAASA